LLGVSAGAPPLLCQLTAVFDVPDTVAAKLRASPGAMASTLGDTVI
jgi:hypothetical protein